MYRAGLKVPEPLFLELDGAVMDRPFFVMHRAPGRVTPGAFLETEPADLRAKVADDFLTELAKLQAVDWRALGLEWLGPPRDSEDAARTQAHHWFEIYERERMGEHYPILDAAFAWLKANPVRGGHTVVVHGDYRSGNYLYDERGIIAMLDWEMTHLGDPMEDLGWASMLFWGRGDIAGGLMDREEFYRVYEQKTRTAVDRARLKFYQVLGNAKMAVICLTGIRDYTEGRTADSVMLYLLPLLTPLLEDLANQLELI
jgi:aminoglycoside phosphotransferase (APT) family kinase protein